MTERCRVRVWLSLLSALLLLAGCAKSDEEADEGPLLRAGQEARLDKGSVTVSDWRRDGSDVWVQVEACAISDGFEVDHLDFSARDIDGENSTGSLRFPDDPFTDYTLDEGMCASGNISFELGASPQYVFYNPSFRDARIRWEMSGI